MVATKRTQWRRVLPRWTVSYFLVLVWELYATLPMPTGLYNSWRGVWLSILALPIASVWLARGGAQSGTLFIFGCGSSLLFVHRFLSMDRFRLWVQYEPAVSGDIALFFMWIAFMLVMGGWCAGAGEMGRKQRAGMTSTEDAPTGSADAPSSGLRSNKRP